MKRSKWTFDQIAKMPSAQLLLETAAHTPQTLFEIHQLAELARRAVKSEAPIQDVVRRVIAACSTREILFGAPSGYLAAHVLAAAPEPIRATFWSTASRELDPRSLSMLRSQYRDVGPPPEIPKDSENETTGAGESWEVSVYGGPPVDDAVIVAAVQSVLAAAKLVERWSELAGEPLVWIFEVPPGVDVQASLRIAQAVASATSHPASCGIPAALGALGPDVVAFCEASGTPALGSVEGDPNRPVLTPVDVG